ncbi:MAG: tetratricopeptide repeat protein [Rhodocyclaceae bacterium]|nr:tetratricopeptide repeat protein [Rhodocyclaceae bacterium]
MKFSTLFSKKTDTLAVNLKKCNGEGDAAQAQMIEQLTQNGLLQLQTGETESAILSFAQAVRLMPQRAAIHNNLGVALGVADDYEAALRCFNRALEYTPDNDRYHLNAANAAIQLRRLDEALAHLDRLSDTEKTSPESYFLKGRFSEIQGAWGEAERHYRQATLLAKDNYEAHLALANVLLFQGRNVEADDYYRQAEIIDPSQWRHRQNTAAHCWKQGKIEEARTLFEALPYDTSASLRANRALTLLACGDYEQGWAAFEARLEQEGPLKAFLEHNLLIGDRWQGESLEGQSVLLWGEQGLGDQIQFVRYLPQVAARKPAEIILYCSHPLFSLFEPLKDTGIPLHMAPINEPPPPFDVYCPLLSLPAIFGTRLDNLPAEIPYLFAESEKTEIWRTRLEHLNGLKVGLVWSGNLHRHDKMTEWNFATRSMTLADFEPLWEVQGVNFISLQKGEAVEQARTWHLPLTDLTEDLHDFSDTAALVMNLDLVISVDTSVVHLTGALGKPIWVLHRLGGCWRWLLDRSDSPWYPTAQIFRQEIKGEWGKVIEEIQSELRAYRITCSLPDGCSVTS